MDKTQEEIYLSLFRAWKNEATSNNIGNIKDRDNFSLGIFIHNLSSANVNYYRILKNDNLSRTIWAILPKYLNNDYKINSRNRVKYH